MIGKVIALAILLAVVIAVVLMMRPDPHPLLVDASAQQQPAFKLFTPCPIDRRNLPTRNERTA